MEEKSNILFLDFDGVINSMRSFWKKFADHYGIEWTEDDFDMKWVYQGHQENMNPHLWDQIDLARATLTKELGFPNIGMDKWPHEEEAIENLNKIIEENEAKVVVCSSWRTGRTIEELQKILDDWGFKGEVIDKTIRVHKDYGSRGFEILEWVMQNRKMIKGICILDDEASYDINAIFKKWAVQDIDTNKHGLLENHIQVANKCFQIPINPLYDFDLWLPKEMLEEARKEDGVKAPSGWEPLPPPKGDMDPESWGELPDWRDTGEMGG